MACSAPAKPAVESAEAVGELKRIVANDCPRTKLDMWQPELFPACGRFPVASGLPICLGSTCAPACTMSGGGFGGPMGRESYEYNERYTYDARGRFTALVYNGKPYVSCEYEGEYMARCTLDGGDDPPRIRSVTRDERGRIVSFNSGDDSLPVTYDPQGRLASIGGDTFVYDDKGWLVQMGETHYEHDAEGHVTKETKGTSVVTFAYEGDRLVHMRGPGPHRNTSFAYDDKGRLERIGRGGLEDEGVGSTVYAYDCK